jgi:hypothetical protein
MLAGAQAATSKAGARRSKERLFMKCHRSSASKGIHFVLHSECRRGVQTEVCASAKADGSVICGWLEKTVREPEKKKDHEAPPWQKLC